MIMPSFLSKLKECEGEICEFRTIEIELLFELNKMNEMNSNLIAKLKSCNDCKPPSLVSFGYGCPQWCL